MLTPQSLRGRRVRSVCHKNRETRDSRSWGTEVCVTRTEVTRDSRRLGDRSVCHEDRGDEGQQKVGGQKCVSRGQRGRGTAEGCFVIKRGDI